jgi:tRNA threonylcarbamoyladenosine biosynthesis protein TsaE
MNVIVKDLTRLNEAARQITDLCGEKRLFAFYGSMGSGKTTIIKAICEYLGAVDIVSSPTFTIVNEYLTRGGEVLYHIDFYRIKKQEEVFDFGIEEYLTGESYCFMEWPELVEEILPAETVKIRISVDADEQRILTIA